MKNFFSKSLIFLGVGLISLASALYLRTSFSMSVEAGGNSQTNATLPVQINIPASNISLPVIPTTQNGNSFTTSSSGVNYLINTSLPGQNGNSVFYGHNWPKLLGNLKQAERGDIITLKYPTGEIKTFTIDLITTISAKNAQINTYSDSKILTLYTCTGFLDSKRLIITANYTGSVI